MAQPCNEVWANIRRKYHPVQGHPLRDGTDIAPLSTWRQQRGIISTKVVDILPERVPYTPVTGAATDPPEKPEMTMTKLKTSKFWLDLVIETIFWTALILCVLPWL